MVANGASSPPLPAVHVPLLKTCSSVTFAGVPRRWFARCCFRLWRAGRVHSFRDGIVSCSALALLPTSLTCTLFVDRFSSENTGTFVTATLAQFRLFQVRPWRFPSALVALLTACPHSAESRRLSRRPDRPRCDHCGRGPYLLSNKRVLLTDKPSLSSSVLRRSCHSLQGRSHRCEGARCGGLPPAPGADNRDSHPAVRADGIYPVRSLNLLILAPCPNSR